MAQQLGPAEDQPTNCEAGQADLKATEFRLGQIEHQSAGTATTAQPKAEICQLHLALLHADLGRCP
jgi:hypothetical protein